MGSGRNRGQGHLPAGSDRQRCSKRGTHVQGEHSAGPWQRRPQERSWAHSPHCLWPSSGCHRLRRSEAHYFPPCLPPSGLFLCSEIPPGRVPSRPQQRLSGQGPLLSWYMLGTKISPPDSPTATLRNHSETHAGQPLLKRHPPKAFKGRS